ncbi:MAG: M28 family peptidase [Flavobacteriaceae bacterium]
MKRLILSSIALLSLSLSAQTDKETIANTISKEKIEGHIYFLADDLLKGRATATPELKIAASYLANQLRGYGVKPNPKTGTYYQPLALQEKHAPETVSLTLNGKTLKKTIVLEGGGLKTVENSIFLGYGTEADFKGKDLKGKVVIVLAGKEGAGDINTAFSLMNAKQKLAKDQGAIGVIELVESTEDMWTRLEDYFSHGGLSVSNGEVKKPDFTYAWSLDQGATLQRGLKGKQNVSAAIEISLPKMVNKYTQNVIGVVEGTDPKLKNEYIIYSGHYDHVGIGAPDATGDTIYNGARDNAVGTTTVLSMAENLAKYPTKRSALFILFTGEESGLLGSKYYVENPVLPLNQMVYCFNSDNAGYNDTSIATIIGLPRTTAAQHIKDAAKAYGITAVDDPAPEQGLFDRSDNVSFAKKGIPSPTFSLGFTSFSGDVTKYYHQAGDEADTLDYDYLYNFFRAYVMAGRKIGNDPKTPVWTAGDKYEAASKKLYKN